MGLLDKFTTIEVDNSQRIPQELKDALDKTYEDYTKALEHNLIYLNTITDLPNGDKNSSVSFYTYYHENKDIILNIKTRIRNLKSAMLESCLRKFNRAYNIDLTTDDYIINGKKASQLYTHTHRELWVERHSTDVLKWDEILEFDPTIDKIIDFVFDKVGFQNLDDVLKTESSTYLVDMYKEETHREPITVLKNGLVTFDMLIVNPTSYNNDKSNIRALKSLTTMLDIWLKTQGSMLDNTFSDVGKLSRYFEIGTYYNSWNSEKSKMYDKLEAEGAIEYVKYFQNGKFKTKFKNYSSAHSFLSFCGLINN